MQKRGLFLFWRDVHDHYAYAGWLRFSNLSGAAARVIGLPKASDIPTDRSYGIGIGRK